MSDKDLQGRTAVVTGASRGIGYFVARELAERGAHVVAIARTVGGLEELDDEIRGLGGTATLVPLDLKDYDALDRLGGALFERHKCLDILVGNAGILGPMSPLAHIDPKKFDEVMAVNVTANWRLLRSLDPLLRQSDAGRAVFLSSGAPHKCKAYWGPYSMSKAALEAMVRTYANETLKTSVQAMLVNPGPMRTGMRAQAMPGEDPETLPHPSTIAAAIAKLCLPGSQANGQLYDHPSGEIRSFAQLSS
ncbi:SDR family NAD(P)-dependent oxidoreductase [Polycladidibacter hongkongensis]|uniref:SDR family NAD(P)-dependent oxidoreductase n=1 Tax=Polycladidibacter hongkongensis TaxID=1647556 RepID=UPI000836CF73|nr:SDR family NAD(P)-dependent oxidoreductase [Pseudovibrio hongkongensis]